MSDSANAVEYSQINLAEVVRSTEPADPKKAASEEPSGSGLRTSPRLNYHVTQWIAPMHGDLPPQLEEYIEVECNDISRGGISFFLKRAPKCQRFAIALGQKRETTTVFVQVAHTRQVIHNGKEMYLVGCRFIKRLQT